MALILGPSVVQSCRQKVSMGDTKRQSPLQHRMPNFFQCQNPLASGGGSPPRLPAVGCAHAPEHGSRRHFARDLERPRIYGILRTMQTFDLTLTRLKQLITESAKRVGDRIPPERALATELGVGRRSLRRALD